MARNEKTSKRVGTAASKVLRESSPKAAKSAAGSALTQRTSSTGPKARKDSEERS